MAALDEDIRAISDLAVSGDSQPDLESRIAELAVRFADLPDREFDRAGPAGALLRAEIVRRRGDLDAYAAALSDVAAHSGDAPEISALSALALDRGREQAMREWSRGRIEAALGILDGLVRAWPNDLDTAAERLFVLVSSRIEDPRARQTVEQLSADAWRHRRLALLASFFHTRKSSFADCLAAASHWADADTGSIAGIEHFATHVSLTIAFRQLLGPGGAGPDGKGEPGWALESAALIALGSAMMRLPRDLREFQEQIFHLVLVNLLELPEPTPFFSVVLDKMAQDGVAPDLLGQILGFFIAHDDLARAGRIAERVQRDEALLSSPHLAKFLVLYAQLAGDRDLETAVLARVLRDPPAPNDSHGNARLQLHELWARAASVPMERFAVKDWPGLIAPRAGYQPDFRPPARIAPRSGGAPRVAIALFGQLRDPDFTLAQVRDYFLEDISANPLPAGSQCRYLLATWNRQAQKRLEAGYPLGEFISLLPPEIARVADGLGLRSSGDFAYAFPALFDELMRRGTETQAEIGDAWAGWARELLGGDALIEVADEAPADHDIERFSEVDPNLRVNSALRNQFKMYHRIAGIGRLVEAWEQETGAPLDLIVLTRPDMLFETGSVMRHARRLLAADTDKTIICDWNPGAMLNEGLGDNIIIGTRRAMATLFAGYSRLSQIFSPDAGPLEVYRSRIWGHRFLGSSVFVDGIDLGLIPLGEIRWRLHRGRLGLATLRGAAAADAQGSPFPEVRHGLAALAAAP